MAVLSSSALAVPILSDGLGLSLGHGPLVTLGHGPGLIGHQAVDYYVSRSCFSRRCEENVRFQAPPQYDFAYGVSDLHTGDNKQQKEIRHGDVVQGEYSLKEADGTIRTVKYTADDQNGFNAVVLRQGHALHPTVLQHGALGEIVFPI